MISALIQHLELADSGLFIHAPDGTCQRLAEALGADSTVIWPPIP